MEPKDLKNSDELKSPITEDLENAEKLSVADEDTNVKTDVPADNEIKAEVETPENKETVEEEKLEPQTAERGGETKIKNIAVDTTENEEAVVLEETKPQTDLEEKEAKSEVTEPEVSGENKDEVKEVNVEPEASAKDVLDNKEPEQVTDVKEEAETAKAEKVIVSPVKVQKMVPVDYSKYSQVELVNAMRDLLDEGNEHHIKEELETIKAVFYKNLNENIAEAKKKFIEDGGKEEEFVAEEDPYEKDIKNLLKEFRHLRIELNKKSEHEKEENLKLKYQVIEDIKGLINNEESINKTFNEFRELQRKWRDIGLVPQSKMKNLWDTYHFHVENFYDYIKINRELRDLDLKKNLEAKIKLCERAEELLVEPSIIKAFNTLQKYHEQWREIGPVPREQKDDVWERFKTATATINKKHQEFFENRKLEQKKNLEAKTALCEKVEEINIAEIQDHKDWDKKSKELVELQKVWRTIGFAPRKDNNKIYDRFRNACDRFFDAKREFYTKNKEFQQNNLQLKTDLCEQAEILKENTDWRKTTQDFINIQRKWKEIGPVPRKQSDIIWKRFRAACDSFFEKKAEHFSGIDSEHDENLKLKETLIEEVINFKSSGDVTENLNLLKDFQRRWSEIGHVPFKKKDELQSKFRDAINKLYDELNIDDEKRNMLKFRSKMSSFSESSRGQNKMRFERDKYMNKMKQLENDLVLLDNNIGFFAKSKNAESLIKDVKKKIEVTKQKIEFLKNKIRVIDEMDNE
ncbi:DUF349 domain-containing protein [Prolixibacteraceae bacterium Z1-6]|uniref:DUF349 domain-containing protein n=1 Tax=Draconibacterium aestuarii TaxID=2998507 RepID=A0A9X3J7P6_9BACT|nr:DUF349 domain-containing protein [Prolixibacteraceae bacterium Z1-6]